MHRAMRKFSPRRGDAERSGSTLSCAIQPERDHRGALGQRHRQAFGG
jgi:hypothetical protein